jgi:hypothetical protein
VFPGVFQVLTHKHKFISLPYEGFSGSTCSWQLLGWMNTQFGWRASPAAFLHAERHLSLESTARQLRVIQVGTATSRKEGMFKARAHNKCCAGSCEWCRGLVKRGVGIEFGDDVGLSGLTLNRRVAPP